MSGNTMDKNIAIVRQIIERALEIIATNEAELGRLDAAAGDGDHGAGMVRGFKAAVAAAQAGGASAGTVLAQAGTAFADAAGGASGALVGTLIMTIGQSLPADSVDAAAIHDALEAGTNALAKLGKAKPGDKTMLDTLDPFVRAYGEAAASGASVTGAWQAALPAGERGAMSTIEMVSKRGRASRLGERSRGHVDAGAMSMLYLLRAVGSVLAEACPDRS
jgi:dihydroxyacetone kinase phosphoprotein-dependent L subunit